MPLTIRSIMTRHPHSVFVADPLAGAYQKMKALNIRHLPVLDGRGKLVGILSDRDFQRVMVREKRAPADESYSFDATDTVEDVMSWPVKLVPESLPIAQAAREMVEEKLSALVVSNAALHPIGIVTTDDLLRYLATLSPQSLNCPIVSRGVELP